MMRMKVAMAGSEDNGNTDNYADVFFMATMVMVIL